MTELNFTPRRTSVNYDINSVSLEGDYFEGETKAGPDILTLKNDIGVVLSEKCDLSQRVPLCSEAACQRKASSLSYNICLNESSEDDLWLIFDLDKTRGTFCETINIDVEEDVKRRVVINFISEKDVSHNGLLKVNQKKGSSLEILVMHNLSLGSSSFVSYENILGDYSSQDYKIVDFSSKHSIHGFNSYLEGEGARAFLKGMYVGGKGTLIDLNLSQIILAPMCRADIDVVGALTGNAEKNFKGTIDFKKGCKKSVGYETELCLLLSDEARSKQLPLMLCTEEEVEGSHSTAVGKIGGQELFYIMSRGLTKTEALKLLTRAKFNKILGDMSDPSLKEEILRKVDERLYD